MTQMTARHSAALCEPSSSAAWRSVIYTSSRIGAMANTPFTRSSWLDELLCVSWTSQLDVWRLLDVCPMFAWWLFCVYTIEQTSRKYEARYSTKHSVHKAIVKANIEQTSTRHRARIEQTSSWLVQLTYSSSSSQLDRVNGYKLCFMHASYLLDVCSMFARTCNTSTILRHILNSTARPNSKQQRDVTMLMTSSYQIKS